MQFFIAIEPIKNSKGGYLSDSEPEPDIKVGWYDVSWSDGKLNATGEALSYI